MNSDYSITETVPVANHVYKYVIGINGSDTIIAERSDFIGNIILSSLNRNTDLSISRKKFKKSIHIVIKDYQYLKNGIYIGLKRGQVFNNLIDKMFRREMYSHCFMNKEIHDDKYLQNMRKFLEIYNINEDDIKLESLYRDFKRVKFEKDQLIA
tara:strand:+ start:1465 stop:1926 length:462 start_codon:yes stop_codon:yes gene_type:complete